MDDLKTRIETFFNELEFTHLKRRWPERLMAYGFSEEEAGLWAVEIGHVVDEYRSSLIRLAKLLEETNTERIPEKVYSYAVSISEVTVGEIQEPMQYLEKQLEKYIPPDKDDED